jgi:hypothetical protein
MASPRGEEASNWQLGRVFRNFFDFFSIFHNFLEARGIVPSPRGPELKLDHSPVIMGLGKCKKVP